MKPRERIRNTMDFREVDSIPWAEEFYPETVNKFFSEGLPAQQINVVDWELDGPGSIMNWPKFMGVNVGAYFGCINLSGFLIPIDIGPIPRFKQRRIAATSKYEDYIMQNGARARRFRKESIGNVWYNMPQFLSFPVSDKVTWEQYKERLESGGS